MKIGTLSRKFLFSKKSHSIINLVSIVSVVAIAVPTAAMIITLSLHNGLTGLIESVYGDFDSDLRVVAKSGQFFEVDSSQLAEIEEFAEFAPTLECNVILRWEDRSTVATLRGVDSNFQSISILPSTIKRGVWSTLRGETPKLVLGAGVSYNMALSLGMGRMVEVYALLPSNAVSQALGMASITNRVIEPVGVYSAEASIDSKYIFSDLGLVRELTSQESGFSSLEVKPKQGVSEAQARAKISEILGSEEILIQNKREQRQSIFSTVEAEKIMLYFTLLLISLIAAMSLAGCTLMMITEKREAAAVLRAIGMNQSDLKALFRRVSMTIVLIGTTIGVFLGVGFVAVQYYFEPFKMGGYQLVVESYPVELALSDLVITCCSVVAVSFSIIYLTVGVQKFKLEEKL